MPAPRHRAPHVVDGERERRRARASAKRRPDPCFELGRRDGLDDAVGGDGPEGVRDGLVAAVTGDEDDREVGQLRDFGHQPDAAGPGPHEVEQHELRPLGTDEVGDIARCGGNPHGAARFRERATHEAKRVRVVVHD